MERDFEDAGDAVWALVEELYQSENAFDSNRIDAAMDYLCFEHRISLAELNGGLNAVHYNEHKSKRSQSDLFNYMIGYTRAHSEIACGGQYAK